MRHRRQSDLTTAAVDAGTGSLEAAGKEGCGGCPHRPGTDRRRGFGRWVTRRASYQKTRACQADWGINLCTAPLPVEAAGQEGGEAVVELLILLFLFVPLAGLVFVNTRRNRRREEEDDNGPAA